MRPLHLVRRNVPGKGGRSGGGKEDREGETVWKFVSPSCRAHFLFSWRSKMGAEGLAARPADASPEDRGEGGFFRIPGYWSGFGLTRSPCPTFHWLAQDPQRSEKDIRWLPSQHTTRQQPLGKDKFRTRTFGLEVLTLALSCVPGTPKCLWNRAFESQGPWNQADLGLCLRRPNTY